VQANAPAPPFDNSYARLPERFFARLPPEPVRAPELVRLNTDLAALLGLDEAWLRSPEGVATLAGNHVPDWAEPIAQAYAGHQFGSFVPQLGDGRAILLAESCGRDGVRRDIQLKGSGRTPFSRMGDGRAWLGPVLREYVVSEAMHALAVPTTRSLAVLTTGERVLRESVLPGGILVRVAQSHVRVGTFQYFAARQDTEALATLVDYVIARHYPDATGARGLLDAVVAAQADLVARWMAVGFIHGVMNTDNTSIAGETIDFGPCAFLDGFDPAKVFSSIDHGGRYAYANQPRIAGWNLARFAETLLPLLGESEDEAVAAAQAGIDAFPPAFDAAYQGRMFDKIGLSRREEGDADLLSELLTLMADDAADFTLVFRALSSLGNAPGDADGTMRALFASTERLEAWLARWRARLALEERDEAARKAAMKATNPAIIPRNHLVEAVIQSAVMGEFGPFHALVDALAEPFADRHEGSPFAVPPRPEQVVMQTFCGT